MTSTIELSWETKDKQKMHPLTTTPTHYDTLKRDLTLLNPTLLWPPVGGRLDTKNFGPHPFLRSLGHSPPPAGQPVVGPKSVLEILEEAGPKSQNQTLHQAPSGDAVARVGERPGFFGRCFLGPPPIHPGKPGFFPLSRGAI